MEFHETIGMKFHEMLSYEISRTILAKFRDITVLYEISWYYGIVRNFTKCFF
jgi:hypothetical protein